MSNDDDWLLSDDEIAELTAEQLAEYRGLLQAEAERLKPKWEEIARPEQLPPPGDWHLHVVLAGRGWGKTLCGAHWAAAKAREYPGARIALVGQTFADVRNTMIEGATGLLSVLRDSELRGGSRDRAYNRSIGEIYMQNGSRFQGFSSEKPNRLRGPQHAFVWGDEPATWLDARLGPAEDTTWSNLELGLRLSVNGSEPQAVLTGTPRPVRLLTQKDREPLGLLHRPGTVITKGHTDENLANLARSFRERVVEPLRGTRIGRQELAAEILEDVEGALFRREWIDSARVLAAPSEGYKRVVVGLDPAEPGDTGSEQALAVVGQAFPAEDSGLFVIASEGHRDSVGDFLDRALDLAQEYRAVIVAERNHGGSAMLELLRSRMAERGTIVPVREVWASHGKRTRAEPVALLAEQGQLHIVGHQPELEESLCTFTGARGDRFDRGDALVWACAEFGGWRAPATAWDGDTQGVAPYVELTDADAEERGVYRWR